VGIPFYDEYVEKAALEYLDANAKSAEPFFMSVMFMKVHQPNMPAPEFKGKSLSKSKYADSIVENDTRIGRIIEKTRLGLDATRIYSGPLTMALGRTSIRMPATHHFAARRHGPRGWQSPAFDRLGSGYQSWLAQFGHPWRPRPSSSGLTTEFSDTTRFYYSAARLTGSLGRRCTNACAGSGGKV
jgi:hypothetical protein